MNLYSLTTPHEYIFYNHHGLPLGSIHIHIIPYHVQSVNSRRWKKFVLCGMLLGCCFGVLEEAAIILWLVFFLQLVEKLLRNTRCNAKALTITGVGAVQMFPFYTQYSHWGFKTGNVRTTKHWGGFVWQLLPWKRNDYYTFWVCVCSLRYPACRAHASYCHLRPAPL